LQRIPNGDGGVLNTTTYKQAIPSPGTENGAVIPAPEAITIAEARALDLGELVTVEGVLTVSDQFSGSAYIQDSTGGIAIFDELVHGDGNFMIGDSIKVTGTRSVFNEQIQISTVTEVVNNGLPNNPIEPITITLAELVNHPGELVRVENPVFESPGNILFGNSNYELTDTSGIGEVRISNNIDSLVGLAQPETCSEVIGVVGKFYEVYQLLPRMREDLSCANEYTAPDTVVQLEKEKALDLVTWNIEWFGDEANSPASGNDNSDLIQKDSVKSVISSLNADIYAVQEIADATLFTEMISELPGYDFVLSDATSYPNDTEGTQQRIGFIYKTETVEVVETKVLLESIHPYYNGGDESALTDFPDEDKTRFYASGRLPFMLTANVTIDGSTEQVNLVNLHARANSSSGPQERYDMRKYDVEVLKDSLDTHYANSKLILLGDYNDDVDVTVADDVLSTVSTYESYVNDTVNYNIVSSTLSDQGYRSYAFRENMIDHIMISDELFESYVTSSEQVHYEFYDNDYTTTSSDHFPVSVQIQLKPLSIDSLDITDVICNGGEDGSVLINVSGGTAPYIYELSNEVISTENNINELVAGSYTVVVKDAFNNSISQDFVIEDGEDITGRLTEDIVVYIGYETGSCKTILVEEYTGVSPYTYEWSTGDVSESIEVCATDEGIQTYSVIITDANGCSTELETTVEVVDLRCDKNNNGRGSRKGSDEIKMCYKGRRSVCVSDRKVDSFLSKGYTLGYCENYQEKVEITNVETYPNPFRNYINISFESNFNTVATFKVYNYRGVKVYENDTTVNEGYSERSINLSNLKRGFYYLKIFVDNEMMKVKSLVKN